VANAFNLRAAAHQAMLVNGFIPDVPPAVQAEVSNASDDPPALAAGVEDLRSLPWSSIDNDTSRDLDQLEVAEKLSNGDVRLRVAIADVDATVHLGSATDSFAAANATSVYTGVMTYPMLPERLSTDLTSLGEGAERSSVVIEMVVESDGSIRSHSIYAARVRNHAKLAYNNVGDWLDGKGELPASATPAIQDQLHLQDQVAQSLRAVRARAGALDLDTIEAESVVHPDDTVHIELVRKTRASHLIEDFMIAANIAMAQFLDEHSSPSIRRVVKTPERWNRIVALAATFGETLPVEANAAALDAFLQKRRAADPDRFPDLSLSVVKLIGPGEYALHTPGSADAGHFGLATHDYTHSTAPNRRFADLVTQRLLKAVLAGNQQAYAVDDLARIAQHCTEREDAARKVERQVRKVAAAVSMAPHVGESFDAIVTGDTPKGTFVRLVAPPVEGRVTRGEQGLDVGDKVRVRLTSTDPARGFVDFAALR
jgi:VacB/RNase II family 3'-5' exoribonuclease